MTGFRDALGWWQAVLYRSWGWRRLLLMCRFGRSGCSGARRRGSRANLLVEVEELVNERLALSALTVAGQQRDDRWNSEGEYSSLLVVVLRFEHSRKLVGAVRDLGAVIGV